MWAGRSGDRIPVGARFSAPIQIGPGAHPASCTMGTGSFPGVKRPGRGADHPLPSKRRGHERVGLYLYSPCGPSWPVIGRTLLYFTVKCGLAFFLCSSVNALSGFLNVQLLYFVMNWLTVLSLILIIVSFEVFSCRSLVFVFKDKVSMVQIWYVHMDAAIAPPPGLGPVFPYHSRTPSVSSPRLISLPPSMDFPCNVCI